MLQVHRTVILPVIVFGCEQKNTGVEEQGVEEMFEAKMGE